ncbi:undecaprenyl-diphosphate phosphatase [Intrasporangium oryzae]|uniref:undecaprenyl-diphosphate phosphatase n=1 Tax=Intrasporangium oryzae TaxID=412687 RepID=UPI0004B8B781|nr:undecaprenyl-diphosphate phosphatase [Intrasporangium oryzae]
MADLSYLDAVVLGVVEGLTEYLPVSSTGHLTIAENLLGLEVDAPAVTAYTAVIQLGAIAATLIYFFRDIVRFAVAWFRGLTDAEARHDPDYGLAWAVVIGSIPVGIVGFAAKDLIEGGLRSLWVVATALILWSGVMVVAERMHTSYERRGLVRGEHSVTPVDGLLIGLAQCFSLIPGVSRSGATISAGLARGIDRVTATRLSFFLAIPALTAAGLFQSVQQKDDLAAFGVGPMIVGIIVAFLVAYLSIAWLLRFVASNSLMPFVVYRVALGLVLAGSLAAGVISAT